MTDTRKKGLLLVPSDKHAMDWQKMVRDDNVDWIAYPHWAKNYDAKYLSGVRMQAFDNITSVDLLHLLNSPIEALSHWCDVLKVDGKLLVRFPMISVDTVNMFGDGSFDTMKFLKILVAFCTSRYKSLVMTSFLVANDTIEFTLIKKEV